MLMLLDLPHFVWDLLEDVLQLSELLDNLSLDVRPNQRATPRFMIL